MAKKIGKKDGFRDAFDQMLEGCQIISPDWRYLYVNEAVAKQGKSTKEELIGHTMMEKYPGIEKTEVFGHIRRCMEDRAPHQMENEFTFPDGSKGGFELRIEPVPEGVLILSLDITNRKKAEHEMKSLNAELELRVQLRTQELKMEKTKLETLLESIGDGVVAIDRAWNITLWNKAAHILTGWTKDEALGKKFRSVIKFIRENDKQENIMFIEEAMIQEKVRFMENHTILIQKDGKEIPVEDSAAPVFNERGEVVGAIIVFRNASQQRHDDMVRSDFAYASHQLRTPVSKALWNLEIALTEKNPGAMEGEIKTAYLSVKSVRKLAEDLLAMSRLEQGMEVVHIAQVKLGEILDETCKECEEKMQSHKVSVEMLPDTAGISVKADKRLLQKIFFEVLDNAVSYSYPKGKVKVSAVVERDGVVIKVEDNGAGIPENQHPLVFTRFFRGSNINTTDIAGTGLGMYLAREYVHMLGGKMWFASVEEKGTTFFIFLPLV